MIAGRTRRRAGGLALLVWGWAVASAPAALDDLRAGRAAFEDRLYALAEKAFRRHLTDVKNDPEQRNEAMVWLLRALHAQQRYEDMQALLDGKGGWGGRPEGAAFSYWRGATFHAQDDPEHALEAIRELFERYPGSTYGAAAERLRAACHVRMKDLEKAVLSYARFEKAHAESPVRARNLLDWGMALQSLGREGEATVVLQRLISVSPDSEVGRTGRLLVGESAVRRGDWAGAEEALKPLIAGPAAKGDLQARAWFGLSAVHCARGATNEAVVVLSNGVARAVGPRLKRSGQAKLGRLLLGTGRIDEGAKCLRAVIQEAPEDPDAEKLQLDLADALLKSGRGEAAVAEFQRYLDVYTNRLGQAAAYEGKGWALLDSGRHAEAAGAFLAAFERFAEPHKKQACLFKVGDAYFANGQYRLAAQTYGRFLEAFPESARRAQAAFQRGESLVRAAELGEAEKQFRALIDQDPGPELAEEAMLRLAELHRRRKRWEPAIAAYEAVMKRFPRGRLTAAALHGRGLAYYQRFRFAEAAADFERLAKDFAGSPETEQAFYMRAMCYYGLGRDKEALETCKSFIERYPESKWTRDVVFWIGKYEYNRGGFEVAEDTFLQFVKRYPGDSTADDALLWAGVAAAKRKEYVRSIELLTRLAKEYPESEKIWDARFAQADAFSELGRFSEAIVLFDEIINKAPDGPLVVRSWGRRGDCQFMLGAENPKRYEEAVQSYRVVANRADAGIDLLLQAEYKIGRCLEKLGRVEDAFEQYYRRVILRYLEEREKGTWLNEAAKIWFTRAAFNAADILEGRKEWHQEMKVLERVIQADVPAASEARERIRKIRLERWRVLP